MLLLSGVILSYHSGKINLNNESLLFATARYMYAVFVQYQNC
jgi:hypothetical protein